MPKSQTHCVVVVEWNGIFIFCTRESIKINDVKGDSEDSHQQNCHKQIEMKAQAGFFP